MNNIWTPEVANESARTLLPPLEYLAREARASELNDVAAILENAIADINRWIVGTMH
ncbi:MAG: hypothetical protein O2910_05210 [Proteobacteria bacterium]|nr:hypothetical protein [Pseudomonadota bacterium]